jgi:hypothetical protein
LARVAEASRPLAELPDARVHQALEQLRGGGFLYERSAFPEPEYAFKHALTHEVAYATLLSGRRRALHARILEAVETEYAGRLGEHTERLAHHAAVGQVWGKAVTYLRQASAKVGARAAYAEAGQYVEHALEAVARLPDDREKTEQSIDVHFNLRHNCVVRGETARGYEHLVIAEREARLVGDHLRLGFVVTAICHHHWMVGKPVAARRFGQEAVALAEGMGDKALQVYAHFIWGFACSMWGDSGPARVALRRVVELVGEDYFPTRGISAYPGSADGPSISRI